MAEGKMKGGIRKRGDGYQVKVYAGRDGSGKKKYVAKTFRTKHEAEHWRAAMLTEYHETGEVFEPTKKTVSAYLSEWIATIEPKRSPATVAFYRLMANHAEPSIGALPLPRLTPARLQDFYADIRDAKTTRVQQGIHDTLSAALTKAVRLGLIRENPCRRVERPAHKAKETQALTAEEARAFLTAAASERLYPLWLLAVTTALRRGELCGLRWRDVDLDSTPARLTVRQELIVVDGHNVFKEPKSKTSEAAVPILPEAAKALGEWKTQQAVERRMAGPNWTDHENGARGFCQDDGKPLHPNNLLKRDFRRILARAGLSTAMRIHDLRHTVASVLIGGGVDPKTAQALLRHARITTTLGIYTHLTPGLAEQALEPLGRLIPRDDAPSDL